MLFSAGGYNSFLDLITVLLIFVFVIAITLFTTKYLANYQRVQNAGKNIEVLETYKISQTKYIQIVKIGKKCVAIAVSKDTVTLLTALEEADITIPEVESDGKSFREILENLKKQKSSNDSETLDKTETLNIPDMPDNAEILEKTDSLEEEK